MNSPYIDPNDLLDAVQQQEMIIGMAFELVESCDPGWEEISFEAASLAGVTSASKWVVRDGAEREREQFPSSVAEKSIKLRTGMYQDDVGTWLSMRLHIIQPGKYKADFNYDDMPSYTLPPSAKDFASDLIEFPRHPDNTPDWLEEAVRRAGVGKPRRRSAHANQRASASEPTQGPRPGALGDPGHVLLGCARDDTSVSLRSLRRSPRRTAR